MDYAEQDLTEWGRRVSALLHTTWASWLIAQQREDVHRQVPESEDSRDSAERNA